MSYAERLRHTLLIKHPDPGSTPDETGQLFLDETGQPIGDATADPDPLAIDWSGATAVRGLVQERRARWPEGPGAGPELVDTMIFLDTGVAVRELDKVLRTDVDPEQAYQIVFVDRFTGYGRGDHVEAQARRIPL